MHDAEGVEILNGQHGFGKVESGHVGRERADVLEQVGAVTTLYVLHDHAQVFTGLETAVHGHYEWVVCEGHDVALSKHLLNLKEVYN